MSRDGFRITETGDGPGRWIADLKAMERDPRRAFGDRLDHAVSQATELLRAAMPVRTGNLARSGSWSSHMAGDVYEAAIEFGGETAPYAPFVIGQHVNGVHPWDAAWAEGQALVAAEVLVEFPSLSEREL